MAVLALVASGCGETVYVTKLTPTTVSPAAEDALAFPRQCDANRTSAHPSWWLRVKCTGESPLPAECEKPGTYKLPTCEGWLLSQVMRQQEQESTTDAAIDATIGVGK